MDAREGAQGGEGAARGAQVGAAREGRGAGGVLASRPVPSPVARRRLEIFSAARADPAAFLRLDPAALRFSVGSSLADVSVPLEVAADVRAIVRGAASEIALLLATHHRTFVAADDVDRLILRPEYASLPAVLSRLGPCGGGPDLRGAAQLAHALHPALTGGIACAWMGKGGKGRSLVALWIELIRRAVAEMAEARVREPTPLLVALALARESQAAEDEVRECLPSPPVDRYLRTAAMSAAWLAARTGLARAWRDAGRSANDPLLLRIEAVLAPAAFLGGRSATQGGGATAYGCDLSAGVPRADDLVARLAAGGDAEAVASDLAAAIRADDELDRRAELAAAVARLREMLAAAVVAMEDAGAAAAAAPVRAVLCAPGVLLTALGDDGSRKALAKSLPSTPGDAGAPLEAASRALRGWKPRDPCAAVGLSRKDGRLEYALAAAALLADLALDRMTQGARRALSFRTGREAEGGADSEWEAGRLYRLSARGGAILQRAQERPAGHLFADVKDFTRRTALLGQASMAEFLRREFYLPILSAAKAHFDGMEHLADRGGVVLNNLLGDAVSFSGRIEEMVALAKTIRAELDGYAARLAREISSDVVARQIAVIEEGHAEALAAAREEVTLAEAAAAGERETSPRRVALAARVVHARADEARLEAERERALARARGEVLEAGVFVSYGAAPLVVLIDDEVFGRNRVAIAEKINESARGTARAPSARARADGALARERAKRNDPSLGHAFSVFIGQPLHIPVPPDAEERAVRLFRAGNGPAATQALAAALRDGVEALSRDGGERPGDVYNSGAALSEEALLAYVAEIEGTRPVRRVEVAPDEIPQELRARWFFGDEPLSLIACFHEDGRVSELFRRVGAAAFKGLGGVVVWELCADSGGPGALARALGRSWLTGAA